MENNLNEEKKENKEVKKHVMWKMPKVVRYIIIIAILIGIFYLGTMSHSFLNFQTKTTKLGLEDVGELVTQTAYLTVVEDTNEHKEFFNLFKIPFTESRQIFSYDIEVDASLDFSKITYNVNNSNKEINIKLPHCDIYKSTLNEESLKVYLDSNSIFSRIDLKEHNDALQKMKEQGIEDAKANGILDAADANAKKLIESFIKKNDAYKDYKVVYEYV